MNIAGQYSLSGTALALNKQRHVRGGEFLDFLTELLHDGRAAKDYFFSREVIYPKHERNSLCGGQNHFVNSPKEARLAELAPRSMEHMEHQSFAVGRSEGPQMPKASIKSHITS